MLIQKSELEDPNFCLTPFLSEMLAIPLLGEYVFDQRTIANLDALRPRNSSGFQMVIS